MNNVNIHDLNEDGLVITPKLIEDLKQNKNYQYLLPIFFHACRFGDLNLVKHCLNNTDLPNYSNLEKHIHKGFEEALHGKQLDVASYFIFELNISKNDSMDHLLTRAEDLEFYFNKILKKNNKYDFINKVRDMFKIREINHELKNELPINKDEPNTKLKL